MLMSNSNNNNNENSLTSKTTTTTTPTNSLPRPRRAFGDISNKKTTKGAGEKGGSNNVTLKPLASRSQPSKKGSVTPRGSIQQFPSRIPNIAGSKTSQKPDLSKRAHPWSMQAGASSNSLTSSSPVIRASRQVEFILPTSTTRKADVHTKPTVDVKTTSKVQIKTITSITDKVEDVELPAGRLWVDQLRLDVDDEASTSSLNEILESRTMWDDYKESMVNEWEEERKKLTTADEAIMQSRIDEMLRDDEKGMLFAALFFVAKWACLFHPLLHPSPHCALQPLLPSGIDYLFDFSELSLKGGLGDPNLDSLLEDDEWSSPASSVVGALGFEF
jgi:hypothetical protein